MVCVPVPANSTTLFVPLAVMLPVAVNPRVLSKVNLYPLRSKLLVASMVNVRVDALAVVKLKSPPKV